MKLDDATDELYRVFARYPRPAKIDYCAHCVREEDLAALSGLPLRTLGADDVGLYVTKVFSTVGSDADFRHFLPRLLELLARGELDGWTGELLITKVCTHSWELERVQDYLMALWTSLLQCHPAVPKPHGFLTALCRADRDCSPYLAALSGPVAALHLADLVTVWHPRTCEASTRWLVANAGPMLEHAVLTEQDPDALDRLSHAYDALDWLAE